MSRKTKPEILVPLEKVLAAVYTSVRNGEPVDLDTLKQTMEILNGLGGDAQPVLFNTEWALQPRHIREKPESEWCEADYEWAYKVFQLDADPDWHEYKKDRVESRIDDVLNPAPPLPDCHLCNDTGIWNGNVCDCRQLANPHVLLLEAPIEGIHALIEHYATDIMTRSKYKDADAARCVACAIIYVSAEKEGATEMQLFNARNNIFHFYYPGWSSHLDEVNDLFPHFAAMVGQDSWIPF